MTTQPYRMEVISMSAGIKSLIWLFVSVGQQTMSVFVKNSFHRKTNGSVLNEKSGNFLTKYERSVLLCKEISTKYNLLIHWMCIYVSANLFSPQFCAHKKKEECLKVCGKEFFFIHAALTEAWHSIVLYTYTHNAIVKWWAEWDLCKVWPLKHINFDEKKNMVE